ncbi:MAG: hypothetical protein ACFFAS_10100 [Promethearchaeota archaeon]
MDPQNIKEQITQELKNLIPELNEEENEFNINHLTSKQNVVVEVIFKKKPTDFPKVVVLKLFQTENIDREFQVLKKLEEQQILVPKVLIHNNSCIMLEKIVGINLTSFINNNLKNISSLHDLKLHLRRNIKKSVKKLGKWFAILHKRNVVRETEEEIVVLNKGDARLRDFLYNPETKEIYGLDFEDAYEGNYLDDLAWICCSLLDTDPGIFEMDDARHKIELIKVFLKKYYKTNNEFRFNFNYFAEQLIENLNTVIERRDLDSGLVRKEIILKNLTNLI